MGTSTEGITVLYHPNGLPRIKEGTAEGHDPYWVLNFPVVNPDRPSDEGCTNVFLTKAQLLALYREVSRALEQWGCVEEADALTEVGCEHQEEE